MKNAFYALLFILTVVTYANWEGIYVRMLEIQYEHGMKMMHQQLEALGNASELQD